MAARAWAMRVGDRLEGVARGAGLRLVWREQPAALLHLAVGTTVFVDPREDELDDALRVLPEVARRVLLDHHVPLRRPEVRRLTVALYRRLLAEAMSTPGTTPSRGIPATFKKS